MLVCLILQLNLTYTRTYSLEINSDYVSTQDLGLAIKLFYRLSKTGLALVQYANPNAFYRLIIVPPEWLFVVYELS